MLKKNKVAVIKDPNCLNCGYPFNGQEKFCPDCGQKNKGSKLTFGSFIKEVFNGFITWDAKFWKTIIPLIVAPGKVSKDYVEGKRIRYANPFRFYITTSIIFFLVIGITDNYSKFKNLREGTSSNSTMSIQITKDGIKKVKSNDLNLDSIQEVVYKEIDKSQKINDSIKQSKLDSIEAQKQLDSFKLSFLDQNKVTRFMKFQKENPKVPVDAALDSLHLEKNFSNRYWYSRAKVVNAFISNKGEIKKFNKQLLSYGSIALFILLPLFTFFLKIIYIRRKYTYVEHLVFVFHTQTVFFLLFTIFYIINFYKESDSALGIFLLIFMLYLFLAMKKFYNQNIFKTFIKYCIANTLFTTLIAFGIIVISTIAFILY